MECPSCNGGMVERMGMHGAFLFCPKQATCGQRTITKELGVTFTDRSPVVHNHRVRNYTASGMQSSIRRAASAVGLASSAPDSWVDGLGNSYDSVNNEGDWYRPY